jgi:hypothetical protein
MSKESSKAASPFFSLDDIDEILEKKKKDLPQAEATIAPKNQPVSKKKPASAAEGPSPKQERQRLGAVSASDILGFQLNEPEPAVRNHDESRVPKKFLSYYHQLIELREHVLSGLDFHTSGYASPILKGRFRRSF